MRPVREFQGNFRFDTDAETEPNKFSDDITSHVESHDTKSCVRNICFVWTNGRRTFFNYAYLVSVDLVLGDSLNVLVLSFSGQVVTLRGYNLRLLFDELLTHTPKVITARQPRYFLDQNSNVADVIEIIVKEE